MYISGTNPPRKTAKQPAKVAATAQIAGNSSGNQKPRLPSQLVTLDDTLPANQALVPVYRDSAGIPRPISRAGRISAPLVTHLVATRMGVPQTRTRRRANADHATSTYRDVTQAPQIPLTGTSVSKYL